MVNRIYSVQATRSYKPAAVSALVHVFLAGERRSGAKNAQGGGDCNRDESPVSIHDGFLPLPDATWILGRFQRTARARVHCCGSAHLHYRHRFGGAFFLQWMSCEHPHDRTGRILRSTSVAGRPGSIILKRGTDHAMAISLPPCVIRRAARLATTWRPSAYSSPQESREVVISDRPLLCPHAGKADVIYWDERLGDSTSSAGSGPNNSSTTSAEIHSISASNGSLINAMTRSERWTGLYCRCWCRSFPRGCGGAESI